MTPQERSEIERLARSGNLIDAIKEYRRLTGTGLKEAREAVEAIAAGRPLPSILTPMPSSSLALEEDVRRALSADNKIEAIKIYREATGVSLQEAKEMVEQMAGSGASVPGKPGVQKQGCFGLFVGGLLLAAVLLERTL